MMGKLIKYDLKAGLRIFGLIWMGMVLLTGLCCGTFLLSGQGEDPRWLSLGVLTILPMFLALIGSLLFTDIYIALRFHNGLLGREGYMMFTLPTTSGKLLTSKFLTAVFFEGVTFILFLAGVVGFISTIMHATGAAISLEEWKMIFEMAGFELDITVGTTLIPILFVLILGMIAKILQIYLACCLGHLCRKKRALFSILFYFALNQAMSILTSFIQLFMMKDFMTATVGGMYRMLAAYTIPVYIGLIVVYYILCARILRNKLNLE